MRFPAECPECRRVDERRQAMHEVQSGPRSREPDALVHLSYDYLKGMDSAEVHSDGNSEKVTLSCRQGHETVVTLPIPLFELLFEFGCSALLDGYSREAVTCFASSFERFQEFASRILLARGNLSFDGVDSWWKQVAAQSERQVGSYVALWTSDFHELPPLLPQKLVELRNRCVHKGHIPPESKAKEYGEAVLRAEVRGTIKLRNCFDSEYDYDNFVEDEILRLDYYEPDLLSPIRSGLHQRVPTVLGDMWRRDELERYLPPEEGDLEEGDLEDAPTKNTTDPASLTMDRALKSFKYKRMFGTRHT